MKKDLSSYASIFKQEGTSRQERYSDSLNPGSVSIDERGLEDFIIYAQQYSSNLLFVDTEGSMDVNKSWENFFKDDSVLLNANIATKDINGIKSAYDLLFDQYRREETMESFMRVLDYVASRFRKIDQWYASASPESVLGQELYLYIRSYLSKEFQKLSQIISYVNNLTGSDPKRVSINIDLINKDNIWELTETPPVSLGEHMFAGNSDKEKLTNALLFTNKIFDVVFHATSRIIETSKHYFKESIYKQQDLAPHIALFITFIRLFGLVQEELNKFPAKLLSFYYKDVLKIKAKSAEPDHSFVLFELAKGFEFYKIEKGTPVVAGKDKKKVELVYKTDTEIVVNKARVSSLKTVFIERSNNLVTHYYRDTIKENEQLLPAVSPVPDLSKRTFGAPGIGTGVQTGFALSSNQLYLAKGERNVTITFETGRELIMREWNEFDTSVIALLLTGEKGWISSKDKADYVSINYLKKTGDTILELNFAISIGQPSAVVAFDPKIHGDDFSIDMPVLKILLQFPDVAAGKPQEISRETLLKIKQLNFLLSLNIIKTTIRVQVGSITQKVAFDGIRDLVIENHETVLDPKKPFYPFTTMPKVGSSFYIGCDDLYYKKNIENLSINIDWMLPENFYTYYDKYFPPYDSNKFLATLSVLKDQFWINLKDTSIIDSNANEPRYRVIKVPNKKSPQPLPGNNLEDVSKFDVAKKDGTLKLKINYPDFGHDIYAQLITSIAMEKASSKLATVDFYKIIKKEFGDAEISIKLPPPTDENYKVNAVMNVLATVADNEQAKVMMVAALNYSLIQFNGVNIVSAGSQPAPPGPARTLVNDDNFIERILRFLKKVKLIDRSIHFDQDKDSVGDLVDNVDTRLSSRIDFILPADQEMVSLIISEVNNAIGKVIVKAVDKIIEVKKARQPDEVTVVAIITKEIDAANEVINDLVARKIATLLSAHDVPPKPYTPLINTLAISYTSVKELTKAEDRFFHILPFGVAEIDPFTTVNMPGTSVALTTNKMFPRSFIPENNSGPSGILFIGVKELSVNDNLSLFFQLDQSTKRSAKKPAEVNWWYLQNNEWIPLKKDLIISDSTYGLQTTGIIEIAVPQNINNRNTIFDERGLFWLCASVIKDVDAFPDLEDIKAQAVSVTFENNANDPIHFAVPLPANKISKLEQVTAGIKAVSQPVASFNGKMEEAEPEFYTRVSERLRHKSRAVNNWDYERLTLEQFPFIYKVKCLNNYYLGQFIPGHITVVPIVNLNNNSTNFNPEIPSASYLQLRRIEEFLKQRSSAFVKIHAINPRADYIKINCKVKFKQGVNKGYYLQKLNEELVKFLTPWAVESDTLSFSAKIYASSIVSFIDKLKYVDYVADLSMNQFTVLEDGTINYCRLENQTISLTETQITTAHSILVSAKEHDIELV